MKLISLISWFFLVAAGGCSTPSSSQSESAVNPAASKSVSQAVSGSGVLKPKSKPKQINHRAVQRISVGNLGDYRSASDAMRLEVARVLCSELAVHAAKLHRSLKLPGRSLLMDGVTPKDLMLAIDQISPRERWDSGDLFSAAAGAAGDLFDQRTAKR